MNGITNAHMFVWRVTYLIEKENNQLSILVIRFSCPIFVLDLILSEVFLCYCSDFSRSLAEEFCSCSYR